MSRRRHILILLAIASLIGLSYGVLHPKAEPPEPSYAGKTLSAWLAEYEQTGSPGEVDSRPRQQAEHAIRRIGTNALPSVLRWMRYEPTPEWKLSLDKWWDKFRRLLSTGNMDGERVHVVTSKEWLHRSTLTVFAILGPEAKGAVPALSRMIVAPKANCFYDVTEDVIQALAQIGATGLPPVMAALTNRDPRIAACAAGTICRFGTNARPAVPVLVGYLNHKDERLATAAAWSLAELRLEPALVIPALARGLRDPRPNVRLLAVSGLWRFGPEARAVAPELVKLLNDPSPVLQTRTRNALLKIAPGVLTNTLQPPNSQTP